jgi:hypothetical protein
MGIEDLQLVRMPAYLLHQDRRVLAAPSLAIADCQIDVPLTLDGVPTQGGVAVPALAKTDVVTDRPIRVTQLFCQVLCEVELSRSGDSFIDLLEQNDVGAVIGQDCGDAIGSETTIHTDRPVDVVGGNPQSHE